ncbi:hypothetical protein ACLB2K_059117 [Fragaria x ananassa]
MIDEVSKLMAALAISEKGKVSFEAARAAAYLGHAYAVGRLLSSKNKVVSKSFMATMAAMWGKKNQLQIGQEGDQYVLRFSEMEERDQIVRGGPWFYGKSMFSLANYNGRTTTDAVPITTIPVWVEIFGLPPDLKTKEALFMVGATLWTIIQPDLSNLKSGARARIRIEHRLDSPVKQAYPPMVFEFGEGNDLTSAWLTFKYERMCGFCLICGPPDMSAAVRMGAPSDKASSGAAISVQAGGGVSAGASLKGDCSLFQDDLRDQEECVLIDGSTLIVFPQRKVKLDVQRVPRTDLRKRTSLFGSSRLMRMQKS